MGTSGGPTQDPGNSLLIGPRLAGAELRLPPALPCCCFGCCLPAVYFCNRSWRLWSGSVAKDEIQEKTCLTCSVAPPDYSPTDDIAPQSPSRLGESCSSCPASATAHYFSVRTSAPSPHHRSAMPLSSQPSPRNGLASQLTTLFTLSGAVRTFHTQFLDSVLPPAGSGYNSSV